MLVLVTPVLQVYVVAPEAVKISCTLSHMLLLPAIESIGNGVTVIDNVSVGDREQEFCAYTLNIPLCALLAKSNVIEFPEPTTVTPAPVLFQ